MMRNKIYNFLCRPWGAITLIYVLTFSAYSNVFHNTFFMDDLAFIVDWPLIRDWGNLPQFFIGYTPPAGQEGIFSPLKTLVHAVNFHFFGLDPFGHHVFAFVNYLVAIGIVYAIGFIFLKDRLATFLCALLFALHPVHIEYVSSLTGSVDALGVNLLFISFYLYVKAQKGADRFNRTLYGWSLCIALVSIYMHELCITLPVMFLWYDLCYSRTKYSYKKIAARITPFFLFSISYVLAKYWTLGAISRGKYLYGSFYLTMLVTIKAWAKYVYISFFPVKLTYNHVISSGIFSYDQEDFDRVAVLSQSIFDPQVLMSLLVLGAIAVTAVRCFRNKPIVSFCIGWFFIGILPGSNIVPSAVYFAERYLYPGSLGLCLLFGLYMSRLFQSDRKVWKFRWASVAVLLTIFISVYCVLRIWVRNLDGRSEISLHQSAVRENPYSALMRTDLGQVYLRDNMPEKALEAFQGALVIRKDDPVIYFSMADAYMNIGKKQEAIDALKQAIAIKPDYPEAYYNLAGLYADAGLKDQSRKYLDKAVVYFREQGRMEEGQNYYNAFTAYFGGN